MDWLVFERCSDGEQVEKSDHICKKCLRVPAEAVTTGRANTWFQVGVIC